MIKYKKERKLNMLEVKLLDNNEKEYGIYYFEDILELTNYLDEYNVTLIWKHEI